MRMSDLMSEIVESGGQDDGFEGYKWIKKAGMWPKMVSAVRKFSKDLDAISKESHKKLGNNFPSKDWRDLREKVATSVIDEFYDMGIQ